MDSREAFIALNMIESVGPVRARSLLEHFGEAPKILAASKSALIRVRNIGDDVAEKIASWEKTIDLAAVIMVPHPAFETGQRAGGAVRERGGKGRDVQGFVRDLEDEGRHDLSHRKRAG